MNIGHKRAGCIPGPLDKERTENTSGADRRGWHGERQSLGFSYRSSLNSASLQTYRSLLYAYASQYRNDSSGVIDSFSIIAEVCSRAHEQSTSVRSDKSEEKGEKKRPPSYEAP